MAGRLEWPRLVNLVGELFGDWTPGLPDAIEEQPAIGDSYLHLPYDSQQTGTSASPMTACRTRDPDYFQAWGGRRHLERRHELPVVHRKSASGRGLCYTVYASLHTLARSRRRLSAMRGTGAERAQQTLDVTLSELTRLAQGIEEHEIERLKARIKSALVMQQESSSARSASLARDWYYLGRARTLDEVGQLIDGLSSRSINAYLAAHPPGEFTVVTVGSRELEAPHGVS